MYIEEWVGRLGLIEMGGVYMREFMVEKGRWMDGLVAILRPLQQ